jgi:pyruvate/2-oxoglutarate dehydrogenase complex dihydrolipoamide dehydrogenase (E3) component
MRRVREVVDYGREFYERRLAANDRIRLVRSAGRFRNGGVEFDTPDGPLSFTDVPVVVATGARPAIPDDVAGLEDVPFLTNESFLELDRLPASIAIIGAGPIGVEFAQALARLDVATTLLLRGEAPLSHEEPDARETLTKILVREGVRLAPFARAVKASWVEGGIELSWEGGTVVVEQLLVATGREPAVDVLDPEAAGLELVDGGVEVDEHLATPVDGIWALGDAIGGVHRAFQYTHVATYEGPQVAENILRGGGHRPSYAVIPRVTFTDPEVAAVGYTEMFAVAAGHDVVTHVKPIREVGKARAMGETEGFVKIVLDRPTGRLLGATIMSPHAGDMLPELTMPMHVEGGTLEPLLATMHGHPTLAEAVKVAAREAAAKLG